jgi:NAD(P)-dependent dehydrogenase (short-subunit alcohol dehydrogenase family)
MNETTMLKEKVAIITGACQGIGYACAERFIKEGAKVVLSDVNDTTGEQAAQRLREQGGDAVYTHCDVSNKSDVEALFDLTIDSYNRVDTVIANAGIVHVADILELEESDFDRVLSINLKGVFLIIPKGGVTHWTKCLGIRMANEGVRVNGIGPGSINTEMFQAVAENPQKMKEIMSRTPMQRPGEPDEVAKVAVFLASNYSSYMTGETVYVDGGRMGLNYVVPVTS